MAFRGWNDVWLENDFRQWDISEELAYIRVPILIVQGEDDQYGTARQIEIAKEECYCPVEVALLPGVKHQPHREGAEVTLKAITDFVGRVLRDDREHFSRRMMLEYRGLVGPVLELLQRFHWTRKQDAL